MSNDKSKKGFLALLLALAEASEQRATQPSSSKNGKSSFSDLMKEMLQEKLGKSSNKSTTDKSCDRDVKVKSGDKVEFIDPTGAANYLVDKDTMETIAGADMVPIDLIKFLDSGIAIFGEKLEKPIEYKCGHCNKIHEHDCTIYIPLIKKTYYTNYDELVVASED